MMTNDHELTTQTSNEPPRRQEENDPWSSSCPLCLCGEKLFQTVSTLLGMIRFSHTLFAMPFAVMGAFLAAGGVPPGEKLFWIVVAMVGARSAAMAFNRLADEKYDRLNPRTANWALAKGIISRKAVWLFTLLSAALFVYAAYRLNPLAFALSPVALGIVLGYSFTKRFTVFSHAVLGIALGIAPIGAWIGVQGTWSWQPVLLGVAVIMWVAGFDMIYACQDRDFDVLYNLRSIPQTYGIATALRISTLLHAIMVALLFILTTLARLGGIYVLGVAVVAVALLYEHSLVKPNDLSRVNSAFFTVNGFVSLFLMCATLADIMA